MECNKNRLPPRTLRNGEPRTAVSFVKTHQINRKKMKEIRELFWKNPPGPCVALHAAVPGPPTTRRVEIVRDLDTDREVAFTPKNGGCSGANFNHNKEASSSLLIIVP
jgi:hypothetical protein